MSNIILIPKYGMEGAAMATALALFIHNIIKTIVVYFTYDFQPFNFNFIKIIFIGIISYFIVNLLPFFTIESILLRIFLRSICITTLYLGSSIFFRVSDDVNKQIKSFLKYK